MRDNIAEASAAHMAEVQSIHRDLLEKAMHMRCISYLADAKARLLVRTVATIGQSKRKIADANTLLEDSLARLRAEMDARRALERELGEVLHVVDAAPVMIAIARDGVLRYANRAFVEAFVGDGAAIGARLAALFERASADPAMREALAAGRAWSGEARLATARGGAIWGRVRLGPLAAEAGEPARLVVFVEDVTREHEAAELVARARRVETLGQLTGGIAHDFNNLLMVIASNAEALSLDHEGEPGPARNILDAAARGASLTRQLLASARRQVLKPERVDVGELLVRLRGMLSRTLGERFTLRVEIGDERCAARCDPGLLEAALVNLVLNARDASGTSGEIAIACAPFRAAVDVEVGPTTLRAGDYVRVSVTDHGSGVPAELGDRVWEPFFTTKATSHNSGLGLSSVLGFAQESSGAVDHEPGPGGGTTFHLYLPVLKAAARAASRVPPTRGRLLLVEDDPNVQLGLSRLIERLGFSVTAVRDLSDASAELSSGHGVDVLLTDMVLRGSESGVAVASEARKRIPALPVVFMSGYSHDVLEGLPTLEGGKTEFLMKPFFKDDLDRALRSVLHEAG
jgi:PAS domain S-box-containing protein